MSFPILVEAANGGYCAQLLGAPQVQATAGTRELAVDGLRKEIAERVAAGQLMALDLAFVGVSDLAGKYADDPTLSEICAEAYRMRDAEPRE